MSSFETQTAVPIYSELARDDPSLAEIVEMFVNGLSDRLQAMQASFDNNDLQTLRRLAHQLKGSGGGHGYPLLSEKAAELEKQAGKGVPAEVKRCIEEIAELIARLRVLP